MYLNHQHRKITELVIESSYEVDERTKNKLYLALVLMMILVFGLYGIERYVDLPQNEPTHEPSHDIIIWAIPENYTYEVEIFIYGNQQDAINGKNRLAGTSITVRPDMSGRIESALYSLPYTYNLLWLRIGFGYELAEDDWQWVYTFDILRLGVELYTHIEGHDFTILVTPSQ